MALYKTITPKCILLLCIFTLFVVESAKPPKHIKREKLREKVMFPNIYQVWFNTTKNLMVSRFKGSHHLLPPDAAQCIEDTETVFKGVEHRALWALRMADASTKLQSGILEGNIVDLGQYDECIKVVTARFNGKHCLVGVTVQYNSTILAVPKDVLDGGLVLTTSVCMPSSCDTDMIEFVINNELRKVNGNPWVVYHGLRFTAHINSEDCHTKDTKPFTWGEYTVIGICIVLLLIVLSSTVFDEITTRINGERVVSNVYILPRAFSATRNFRRLCSTNSSEGVLAGINGARFLCIAWVALGHRYKFICQNPIINLLHLPDVIKSYGSMLIINATLSVDVFFLLGGMLNSYIFMRLPGRSRGCKLIIIDYVHRYMRLTPTYALMIAITATWLYRLGDGPLWDRLVGSASNDCKLNWLPGILYINNYYKSDNYCMMQSWYLSADMQMFWFSPLILYPLYKWPKVGIGFGIVLVIVSVFIPFYVAFVEEIATPIPLSRNHKRVQLEMDTLYLPTHTKTVSYVVGILLGYLIYLIKTNRIKWDLSMGQRIIGWLLTVIFLTTSLFGAYPFFQTDYVYNRWESSLYIGFYRLFWSFGVGWIILSCVTGQAGILGKFLSCTPFTVLGRLTYTIYLTHVAVILYKIGQVRQPPFLSHYDQVTQFLGEFLITIVCSVILTLSLESPFLVIEKIVLRRGGILPPEKDVKSAGRSSNATGIDELGNSNTGLQRDT